MCRRLALYVDCNCATRSRLDSGLESIGFELHKASTASVARKLVREHYYRLVLIDYASMVGEILKFCRSVHNNSADTLIMVLMDKIRIEVEEQLFDCGVNDVLMAEQADANVLTKRIQVRFRNSKTIWHQGSTVRIRGTVIDFERREVWCNGTGRRLPGILVDLLKYFIDHPDRVISRKELEESPIWADSICTPACEGGKTFDVNMSKLRKIIEADATHPRIIKSVRGVGWKLARS
jgi:DNA-binding response OmpR family regulator